MQFSDFLFARNRPIWLTVFLHTIFWGAISLWIWNDIYTIGTAFSRSDYIFCFAEIIAIIICFYTLAYCLTKSLPNKFYWFILSLIVVFILSEYYIYILFTYYRATSTYLSRIALQIHNATVNIAWWEIWMNKIVFYMTMAFHFFYLIIPFSFKSIYDLFKYVQETNRLEKENIQLELNFLRAQINPHFLFNTLNNIYSMSIDTDEKVANCILKLSDLMRYSLYQTGKDLVSLTEEVEFIKNYIDLEKIRLSQRASIKFTIGNIWSDYKIPPLVLLTFVENAFKHGIHSTRDKAWIDVDILVSDGKLYFNIKNSVPLKKPIANVKSGGIGLSNTQRRLDWYYKGRYELKSSSLNNMYSTKLLIKL